MRSLCALCLGIATLVPFADAAGSRNNPLPVFFFRNNGEAPEAVKFIARTPEMSAAFRADRVDLRLHGTDFRVSFQGSDPGTIVAAEGHLAARANFLLGNNPGRWRANVDLYQTVAYSGLYPGIDMKYGGSGRQLKSEFIVAAGADPSLVHVRYTGFEKILIDHDGSLVFQLPSGELRENPPEVYQVRGGRHVLIECSYKLHGDGTVGFAIGKYDRSLELVIDPVLSYSTYLGGSGFDSVTGLAVDSSGNAYVTGYTDSLDFPIAGAIQGATGGGVDAFVAKLNPAGTALLYATYIGGSGDDRAHGLTLDSSGNAIITGTTTSPNFPLVAAYQSVLSGGRDAFVAKLNSVGNLLVFSTYFGGAGYENGNGVASDSSGNVYVVGDTYSTNLPVLSAVQSLNRGRQDGFAVKFNSAGALQYSTYLGGAGDDRAIAIAVDSAGAAYITGNTTSPDFPVANAFQPANAGGQDAFVTKLNAAGSAIVYSTYLGGSGGIPGFPESGNGIAVDSTLNAYVTGVTHSANFPTVGALQTGHAGGGLDAFVCKFAAAGSTLVYSTFLGGIGLDTATAIAVDAGGTAYITGNTTSPDFPMTTPLQGTKSGSVDAFVAAVNSSGSALVFSTFFGGNSADGGNAIALNGSGKIWFAGQTSSTNFPLQTPMQATGYSEGNGFITSMTQAVAQKASMVTPVPSSTLTAATVTFTWTNAGASMYWLDVGTAFARADVTTGNVGTATSKTVSGVPVDGSTIYVRLWTNIGGTWQGFDYTYTAATLTTITKAAMISPVPSSTLSGATVTFTWNNSGAAMYWLDVGTAYAHGDITTGNLGTATSKIVTGIPTNAGSIYVRLWSNIGGAWLGYDYTYTAASLVSPKAAMISPIPSSTLTGSAVTFTWNTTSAGIYWLDVGTSLGQANLATGNLGAATSKTVSSIPLNGSTVFVKLWSYFGGVWQSNDYTYTSAVTENPKAIITSPEPSYNLTGSTIRFFWNNSGASSYRLDVGTTLGSTNIYTGILGTATSKTVAAIPLDGSKVYVRLWSNISGAWQSNDYSYNAATVEDPKSYLLSPEPSSVLTGTTVIFTRTNTGASNYWIDMGVQQATGDILVGSFSAGTTITVNNIPRGSRLIYVRLWTFISGAWQANEYTFTGPA